jgi:16S rRNA (uracil1498-N3)-methyltransferase
LAERFYCPTLAPGGPAVLREDEARHLARVRRVEVGDVVELFDGRGLGCRAEVAKLHKDWVELHAGDPIPDRQAPFRLTLATAVPKGERFDWLVEKATELGVARLVPILAGRSAVDPRGSKLERLRRVVVEACKQCGRNRLMELSEPIEWGAYLAAEVASTRFVADPGAPVRLGPIADPRDRPAALAIGPEGGFTTVEIEQAEQAGWRRRGLGPTILRIETAALAGSARLFGGLPEEIHP